jgi:hypothetical protein
VDVPSLVVGAFLGAVFTAVVALVIQRREWSHQAEERESIWRHDCEARQRIDRLTSALRVHDVALQLINEGRIRQATQAMKVDLRFAVALLREYELPAGLAEATEGLRNAVEGFDPRSNPGGLAAIEAATHVFDGLAVQSLRDNA